MIIASYCRVSTDKEDQSNSFEAQQRFFRNYIRSNPEWQLYKIYADEGISGTSTRKRTQFNQMIADAREGKFELILTKEVSRFSRNIVDAIIHTRQLKELGIGVLFLTDGISTLEQDSELRLSIMASLAQEESRKTSTRVKWGQARQMERGVVFGHSLLGYDVREGTIAVNPEGAALVRLIFQKYAAEQMGTGIIAKYLNTNGYRTQRGSFWTASAVVKILKNEKYVGDLVQQKTYTPDYLTHARKTNRGEVPQISLKNHHEPIVSRELWDLAQSMLLKNNKHRNDAVGHSNRYIFSGKIQCGECGGAFVGRFQYLNDGRKVRRWCCGKVVREGASGCDVGKVLRDDTAMQMLRRAISCLSLDRQAITSRITSVAVKAVSSEDHCNHAKPNQEIERLRRKKEHLLDHFLDGSISRDDMQMMNRKYDEQIQNLEDFLSNQQEKPDATQLRMQIEAEIADLLSGTADSEAFYKNILERLTVFKDSHTELRLRHLSVPFCFLPEA